MNIWDINEVNRFIPGCEITHNAPDSLVLWYRECDGGARWSPKFDNWTVSACDLLYESMDTAPEACCRVKDRSDVLQALKALLDELLDKRTVQS